jgi:probable F420-dependent oxidoreductase
MKVGLTAYDVPAREFVEIARAADEAGFDSLWIGEHIVLPLEYTTAHPTTTLPDAKHHTGPIVDPETELVEPLVQLAAAAAVTTRLRLATGIYILPLRHPLTTARAVCTLQELASGRFMFGLGFGWLEEEFDALGIPFSERVSRFEETIEIIRKAWRSGPIDHHGRHFTITGVQLTKHDTTVPLILGGNSERALRRATRLADGWFASGTPLFEEAVRLRGEVTRLRHESGNAPFELTFRIADADPATVRRYADEGFDNVLIWTDQVWPAGLSIKDKRDAMFTSADALGLRSGVVR